MRGWGVGKTEEKEEKARRARERDGGKVLEKEGEGEEEGYAREGRGEEKDV